MAAKTQLIVGLQLDLKDVMPRQDYLHRWLREISAMGKEAGHTSERVVKREFLTATVLLRSTPPPK